jgi:2-polyprenyl-6-methoxyphenol hydroxylase-like FAD-dependent oxidoreductase
MTSVLVVGAGPTGLTLACDLARRGVAVRIIDQVPEFPRGSRGKGLSQRTLEVLDDLGVVDETLASGVTHLLFRKYRRTEVLSEVDPSADAERTPDVPYPVPLMIPQWRVEEILRAKLAEFGVTVELGAELVGFKQAEPSRRLDLRSAQIKQADDSVIADIGDGRTIEADYLVGCDGGRSGIRKALGISFEGSTSDTQLMVIGDVEADGLSRECWHQWFADNGAIMLCPLPGTNQFQLQASPELDAEGQPLPPTLERFQQTFDRIAGLPGVRLANPTWLSTYRVNVRMVDRLRVGRVFLAGDAAHVHPIAGGLGMNTGIQDAYNLGWKLGLGSDRLLDTYEEERLPIAAWLLDHTSELLAVIMDAIKVPGAGLDAGRAPENGQLLLGYPWSRLSRSTMDGPVQGGDRAPDAPCRDADSGEPVRLFDVFRGPQFTLLELTGATVTAGDRRLLDDDGHARRAYGDNRLVLVRPDGYVGLVANDREAVSEYLRDLESG